MAGGALVIGFVFLLFAAGGPLLLYVLVRAERADRKVMDRSDAERAARRDVDDSGRNRR
ncbi:MAG: hypothetical protein ABEH58_09925 [Haloplanus sp.]